jgi:biotin--protein ligase
MVSSIFVYNDYGSSEVSVNQLVTCLRKLYPHIQLELINGQAIRDGRLMQKDDRTDSRRLFCMGGGFDLGYLKTLGKVGCEQIRTFVNSGGLYLGVCAGAYIACDFIEFDAGGPLEVTGKRELGFFPGKAKGPVNASFKYNCESEAMAVGLRLNDQLAAALGGQENIWLYCNGGCYFVPDDDSSSSSSSLSQYSAPFFFNSLAWYDESPSTRHPFNQQLAILSGSFGAGKFLLSGVHFEFNASDLDVNNVNIALNVCPKLLRNQDSFGKNHSNEEFIKSIFKIVFSF